MKHQLVDTHCHIHFPDYELDEDEVVAAAVDAGVTRLICVGCRLSDSQGAVQIAARHHNVWASVGLHPHEGSEYVNDYHALQQFRRLAIDHVKNKVVAIGECGLDYHYMHSTREDQYKLLRFQLDLAAETGLPLIFHVREAFDDFWQIYDQYSGLKGVVHSFSAGPKELEQILARGLYVGLNGIMTFTKNPDQLAAAKLVPLDRLLLETDAPYLTPVPERGRICQPKHVQLVAEFLANLRGEDLNSLIDATTANALKLFITK
jgi:TatD DNase family protein